MKILSASQIREWDQYTILHEPISSLDLMERAASKLFYWIQDNITGKHHFKIFCGKGNNGGDGLALARMLIPHSLVSVYIVEPENPGTNDFNSNLSRLDQYSSIIHSISSSGSMPQIDQDDLVIDAIFGTGLNKPPAGIYKEVIEFINGKHVAVIAIDIPSGMYADRGVVDGLMIRADHTLTFQQPKLAFMMPENAKYFGQVEVLDIGLHPQFLTTIHDAPKIIDEEVIRSIYKKRKPFEHKGNFGHAALLTGSKGLMGAAVLTVKACLRAGAGKVTAVIPAIGYDIMQISAPEAMCKISGQDNLAEVDKLEIFDAIGVGPGIGLHESNNVILRHLFNDRRSKPLVLDADALNLLAKDKDMMELIPPGSVITPHVAEFDRLFGKMQNDFHRMETAVQKSAQFSISIVLKGHCSMIVIPANPVYFNSTGNAGMATGGSGDVLTGIITALLAQGYSPADSCLLGVFLHGRAGDIAAEKYSEEAMIAGDIIGCLGAAFRSL